MMRRSVSDAGSTPWLAYSTPECVVGLIKWPLDCEPRCSMGLIAHPGQIRGLVLSFDGRKLITLGACIRWGGGGTSADSRVTSGLTSSLQDARISGLCST